MPRFQVITIPFTLDPEYAATTQFGECIAHGMLTGAFISAAIAMELPGPGTIYLGQTLQFRSPVTLGDTLTVALEITDKHSSKPWLTISTIVRNQNDKEVHGAKQPSWLRKKETVTVIPPAVQLLEDPIQPQQMRIDPAVHTPS